MNDATLPCLYEMMRAVRAKLLDWSPAIFIGYNSINFDEQHLRQALFRTLREPYLTNRVATAAPTCFRWFRRRHNLRPNVCQSR